MVLVYNFKHRKTFAALTNSKGAFKCISPLESENYKFEIKYIRIKVILDVVNVQAGKCNPGTQILLSQLKTKAKVGWSL